MSYARHTAMDGLLRITNRPPSRQTPDSIRTLAQVAALATRPERLIELEFRRRSRMLDLEGLQELADLRNDLCGWTRWVVETGFGRPVIVDLVEALKNAFLGSTGQALRLLDCRICGRGLRYVLIVERVGDRIVETMLPAHGDKTPIVVTDNFGQKHFDELMAEVRPGPWSRGEYMRFPYFSAFEELPVAFNLVSLAQKMWEERPNAEGDSGAWLLAAVASRP